MTLHSHVCTCTCGALPHVQSSRQCNGPTRYLQAASVVIRTVQAVLDFTPSTTSKVLFPNTPEWQRELTSADKSGRPFHYMNETTAVSYTNPDKGENTITHYSVDRTEFEV